MVAINDRTGLTRYREFGRYNGTDGMVRTPPARPMIGDFRFDSDGVPTAASVDRVLIDLLAIGRAAGSDDLRIEFNLGGNFEAMLDEMGEWDDATWGALGQTRHDFCSAVVEAGGPYIATASMSLTQDNVEDVRNTIIDLYRANPDVRD